MVRYIYFILLFFYSINFAFSESPLTADLLKNEKFKVAYDSIKSDENLILLTNSLQAAMDAQKLIENDPSARAKFFYDQSVSSSPCPHCPKYLNLIQEVNQIVQQVEVEDTALFNEKMTQLNRLKFLYYISRSNIDGKIECSKNTHLLISEEQAINKGSVKLLAEKALALSKVTEIQMINPKAQEVSYFYRGEGIDSNIIIEVVVKKDNSAIIKYYRYDNGLNLPDLEESKVLALQKGKASKYKSEFKLDPSVDTENLILPTDIKIAKSVSISPLTDSLTFNHQSEISYNLQKGNVSIEGDKGVKFIALEGINNTNGAYSGNAVLNYKFILNEESNLNIDAKLGTKIESVSSENSIVKTRSYEFGLTDHNHEYLNVIATYDDLGLTTYGLKNNIKLNEGSVGLESAYKRDGEQSYGINTTNQLYLDRASLKYSETPQSIRRYSLSTSKAISSQTILTTEYSNGGSAAPVYSLNVEHKVNETSSMVLTISNSGDQGTNLIYQYQGSLD